MQINIDGLIPNLATSKTPIVRYSLKVTFNKLILKAINCFLPKTYKCCLATSYPPYLVIKVMNEKILLINYLVFYLRSGDIIDQLQFKSNYE